jgi:hypothetical protein
VSIAAAAWDVAASGVHPSAAVCDVVTRPRSPSSWERYAWAAGIVFVVALVGEAVVSVSCVHVNQDDSAVDDRRLAR